jgi:hypothetical protein
MEMSMMVSIKIIENMVQESIEKVIEYFKGNGNMG